MMRNYILNLLCRKSVLFNYTTCDKNYLNRLFKDFALSSAVRRYSNQVLSKNTVTEEVKNCNIGTIGHVSIRLLLNERQ